MIPTPWDEEYNARVTTIPESEQCDAAIAYANFSAFQAWLDENGCSLSALDAADLLPVISKVIEFGFAKGREPILNEANFTPGEAMFQMEHPGIKALAYAFGESLKTAKNFITCEVHHPEHGPLVATIQKKYGKSPAQELAELRASLAEMRRVMDEVASIVHGWTDENRNTYSPSELPAAVARLKGDCDNARVGESEALASIERLNFELHNIRIANR